MSRARNLDVLGSIPGEDSKLFLCLTLVTGQSNFFSFLFFCQFVILVQETVKSAKFYETKIHEVFVVTLAASFPNIIDP